DYGVELRADDRARRADLEAGRLHAVLADIAHEQPAAIVGAVELLDELHMAPVDPVQAQRVVVAQTRELRDPAVPRRELVPLLARDLARLAADAERRVGEEPHGFRHAHPRTTRRARPGPEASHTPACPRPPQSFSTLQTNAFPSWIDTFGSPTQEVRSFTTSPTERPIQPQCHGIPTWWTGRPS